MCKQVYDPDGARRGYGGVERRGWISQHFGRCQFGEPTIDWIIEREDAFVDQNQRSNGCDRFRHRGDSEDRVPSHWHSGGRILKADRIHLSHFAVPIEQGHDAAHVFAINGCLHCFPNALQTGRREPTGRSLISFGRRQRTTNEIQPYQQRDRYAADPARSPRIASYRK